MQAAHLKHQSGGERNGGENLHLLWRQVCVPFKEQGQKDTQVPALIVHLYSSSGHD